MRLWIGVAALLAACRSESSLPAAPGAPTETPSSASAAPGATGAAIASPGAELARLLRTLSEPSGAFFSRNLVSNEPSYAAAIPRVAERRSAGRAYLGVGPEQNLSYLAALEPDLAFIVDLRRDNALLHLLYQALFEATRGRAEWVAWLTGRTAPPEPAPDAAPPTWLDPLARAPRDDVVHTRRHADLLRRIRGWGVELDAHDETSLAQIHGAFVERGLDLAFELERGSSRAYPRLGALLGASTPDGAPASFVGTARAFEAVARLERAHHVIPVVADFAGPSALRAIGDELRRRHLVVGAFYVSNVEQYLIEDGKHAAFVANVASLPSDDETLLIRAYLDQGRRHPRQARGERTATLLSPLSKLTTAHAPGTPAPSFFQLCQEGLLPE